MPANQGGVSFNLNNDPGMVEDPYLLMWVFVITLGERYIKLEMM